MKLNRSFTKILKSSDYKMDTGEQNLEPTVDIVNVYRLFSTLQV